MDPGFPLLQEAFTKTARKIGFRYIEQPSPSALPVGYSVTHRFRRKEGVPFPVLQIGHGLYAANEAAPSYEWKSFRALALRGLHGVLDGYPKSPAYPFQLTRIDLRYRNTFDNATVETTELLKFLERYTNLRITVNKYLEKLKGDNRESSRFMYDVAVQPANVGRFNLNIGTALRSGEPTILMETLYRASLQDSKSVSRTALKRQISDIIEIGHTYLSEFFETLLTPDFLKKLRK